MIAIPYLGKFRQSSIHIEFSKGAIKLSPVGVSWKVSIYSIGTGKEWRKVPHKEDLCTLEEMIDLLDRIAPGLSRGLFEDVGETA